MLHPFQSRLVVERICSFLPPSEPPCLFVAVERITEYRDGRRQWAAPVHAHPMSCDFGAIWSRHPRALEPEERRVARMCPISPLRRDMPFFLDTVRVLMDTIAAGPGLGGTSSDGYQVVWGMHPRSEVERRAFPLEVLRYMPPSGAGGGEAYVESRFFYEGEQSCLIRRYDGGWMDIYSYNEDRYDQPPTSIYYQRLQGSNHWHHMMDLLGEWVRTLDRWPGVSNKFVVSCPRRRRWAEVAVEAWVSLAAPTCAPVRQTCWAFCRHPSRTSSSRGRTRAHTPR
jgi:hypothetical protein